jgi:hypothetical protein
MDLGGWLRNLGLEQYEAAFRENAIDDTVLPTLTAEDLKDLGVGIVGHRRKLLNAIAALRTDVGDSVLLIRERRQRPHHRCYTVTCCSPVFRHRPRRLGAAWLAQEAQRRSCYCGHLIRNPDQASETPHARRLFLLRCGSAPTR